MNDLLSEWNEEHTEPKGNQAWSNIPGIPAFHHPEILPLYGWGFDVPTSVVKKILALPRETLIPDLELMLLDAEQRYPAYVALEEGENAEPLPMSLISFPAHAIFLLAEVGALDSLGKVCRFLGKPHEMVDYWMGDHLSEDLWMALFRLGKDNLERLQKLVRNHDALWSARGAAIDAVAQVAWHYSGRRKEVFAWFGSLFAYYQENSQDPDDAAVLGEAISSVAELRAPDLLDAIELLYKDDLVDTSICGTFGEVQGDMYEPVNNWAKSPVKGILDLYQHYTDTWEIYADPDEDDGAELLSGGAFLQSKSKSKGLASFNPASQPVKKEAQPGRNDLCPCGSGKKYKKCHG
ncbi:MAG: DUF1186 domain-containing protein [Bacteroidia bacterium]